MMLAPSVFVLLLTGVLSISGLNGVQNVSVPSDDGFPDTSGDINTTEFDYLNRSMTTPSPETEDEYKCSYESILNMLDLKKNSDKYVISRPVKDYRSKTQVNVKMRIYAILDMREAHQMFFSYIWVHLKWNNEHIRWDPKQFCGQEYILVPTKYLWMPDLTIEEMTEQDKATPSTHLKITNSGWIEFRNDEVVESTCKMEVYRFPFDIQSCNISFKSIMHSAHHSPKITLYVQQYQSHPFCSIEADASSYKETTTYMDVVVYSELLLTEYTKDSELTEESRQTIQTQYEWIFISMSERKKKINYFGFNQTVIVYTITMKRRSVLYIANFLLPVLFFLCLDFASFLMSDTGGEKVGFKVTVLLAVTVMQLILNDILPPSSDKIPLIAIYCIGIFTLMLLSLLETLLMMYLIDKDRTSTDKKEENQKLNENPEDKHSPLPCCCTGIKKLICCASAAKEDQSFPKEGCSSPHTEVSLVMEKVYEELGEMRKSITLLSSRTEDEKPGYWTRVAEKINKVFIIFYIVSVLLLLSVLFTLWHIDGN